METVCIKIEDNLMGKMDKAIKDNGYSTKTEFIREAIRKKIEEDEREHLIKEFLKFKGKAKKLSSKSKKGLEKSKTFQKKTTDKENHETGEKVLRKMAKERGWDI